MNSLNPIAALYYGLRIFDNIKNKIKEYRYQQEELKILYRELDERCEYQKKIGNRKIKKFMEEIDKFFKDEDYKCHDFKTNANKLFDEAVNSIMKLSEEQIKIYKRNSQLLEKHIFSEEEIIFFRKLTDSWEGNNKKLTLNEFITILTNLESAKKLVENQEKNEDDEHVEELKSIQMNLLAGIDEFNDISINKIECIKSFYSDIYSNKVSKTKIQNIIKSLNMDKMTQKELVKGIESVLEGE